MIKLIVITEIGFSKRDFDRFGLNALKKYFKILILDFTKLSYPNFFNHHQEKQYKPKKYIEIQSLEHIKKVISDFKPDYAYNKTNNSAIALKILEFIKSNNIKLIAYQVGLVPDINRKIIEKLNRVKNLIFNPINLAKKIKNIIYYNFYLKKFKNYIDILIVTGVKGNINTTKKKIFGHSVDYEMYLKLKKKNKTKSKNKIIFLDQDLPYTPATYMRGESPHITKKKYYKSLNNFFLMLEKITGKKIAIAGHPRADYKKFNPFKKRKIFQKQTLKLVRDADLILSHTTTSVSFAVLFNKPIIFLTTDELIKSFDDYRVHSFSRELDSKLINIDYLENFKQEFDINTINKINKFLYKKYIDNYIKYPASPKKSVWDIVIKNLI